MDLSAEPTPKPHIFYAHNPIDVLLLAGGNNFVVEPDREQALASCSPQFRETFMLLYAYISTFVPEDRIMTRESFSSFSKQYNLDGDALWFPHDFRNLSPPMVERVSQELRALPAGYHDIPTLFRLANELNDKGHVHALVEAHFPSFSIPDTRVVDSLDEAVVAEYLRNHTNAVVKAPDQAGGMGMVLVETPDTPDVSFHYHHRVLIQPYIPHRNSPSITFFVDDSGITEICLSDQIIDGFQYRGTQFPSTTRFASQLQSFGHEFVSLLLNGGYRGYANIDFIETDDGVFFSELNARIPYNLYPYTFFANQGKHHGFCARQGVVPLDSAASLFREVRENGSMLYFLKEEGRSLRYRCIEFTDK